VNTLWSCEYQDDLALKFIDVKTIQAVVTIISHRPAIEGHPLSQCFFLVEKPGLDVAVMAGVGENMLAEELDEEAQVHET
jgi:hypothetical protein